jgi:hypothetical protein
MRNAQRNAKRNTAFLIASFIFSIAMTTHAIIIIPSDPSWWFAEETPNGSGTFINGPSMPPLGSGSVQLTVDGTGGEDFGTFAYAGIKLNAITSLAYSTYRSSGTAALAPALDFDVDTDASTTVWEGRLVYEPYYTHTVLTGVWQTWNPLDNATSSGGGNWWFTGAPGNALCPINAPCTWAKILANFPKAGIRPPAQMGETLFKAGGGWTSGFVGDIDAFSIGVNNVITTYDFELSLPIPTTTQTFTTAPAIASTTTNVGGSSPSSIYFYGHAYPGGTVNLFRKSGVVGPYEGIPFAATSVQGDGTFEITVQHFLQANYFFAIQAVDKDERESQILPLVSQFVPSGNDLIFKGIIVPPTIETVLAVFPPGQPIKILGYAAPSSTVEVSIDDVFAGRTFSDASGFYTFATSTAGLSLTDHTIKARFVLPDGTASDFSPEKVFGVSPDAFPKTDLNGDGVVNTADLSIFLSRWESPDAAVRSSIDFNGDGNVDISDLSILLNATRLQ